MAQSKSELTNNLTEVINQLLLDEELLLLLVEEETKAASLERTIRNSQPK